MKIKYLLGILVGLAVFNEQDFLQLCSVSGVAISLRFGQGKLGQK